MSDSDIQVLFAKHDQLEKKASDMDKQLALHGSTLMQYEARFQSMEKTSGERHGQVIAKLDQLNTDLRELDIEYQEDKNQRVGAQNSQRYQVWIAITIATIVLTAVDLFINNA